jgi:hypothetical protein
MIAKWLAARRTFPALQLAAIAVIHVGQRGDLQLLSVSIETNDATEGLRADTAFAIKCRSLC